MDVDTTRTLIDSAFPAPDEPQQMCPMDWRREWVHAMNDNRKLVAEINGLLNTVDALRGQLNETQADLDTATRILSRIRKEGRLR